MSKQNWKIEEFIDSKCEEDLSSLQPSDYKEMVELLKHQNSSLKAMKNKIDFLESEVQETEDLNHDLYRFVKSFSDRLQIEDGVSRNYIPRIKKNLLMMKI